MVTVRDFESADYPAVLALDVDEQKRYRGDAWDSAGDRERERFLMTSPRNVELYARSGFCLVAEEDSAIVGFLFALPLLSDVLYVDAVGVSLALRQQGVAREMYAVILARASEHGIRRVQALITPDNQASMSLHLSAGFKLRDRKEAVMEL